MSDDTTFKRCADCKSVYPAMPEYFVRSKHEKSGFVPYCKTCWNERSAKYKQSKRAPSVAIPNGYKICRVCLTMKPATREFFSTNKLGKNGLGSDCKQCSADIQRRYRAEHPDKISASEAKRNPEARKTNSRKNYAKNGREQRRIYVKRHPDKVKASAHASRAMRLGAEGSHTAEELNELYNSQKGLCWWCGKPLNGKYESDHRIPLSRGGTNSIDNIVCSCMRCNRSKHDKMPSEWNGRLL